jgi:hypothetical protein
MAGKLPIRVHFDRTFPPQAAAISKTSGPDGVEGRVVRNLTGAFVDQVERERRLSSRGERFFFATLAAIVNILAGAIRNQFPAGHQREVLGVVLKTIHEQATPRLDPATPSVPTFFNGFDRVADRRDEYTLQNERLRRKKEGAADE